MKMKIIMIIFIILFGFSILQISNSIQDHISNSIEGDASNIYKSDINTFLSSPKYIINLNPNSKSKDVADYFKSTRSKSNEKISEPVNCTDDALGICKARELNLTGEGVSIALIDSQFYIDRLAEREMPKKLVKMFNISYSKYEHHGTACAELIADVAPNVTLYLFGLDGSASEDDLIEMINKISNFEKKIDIISCSSDFNAGLFNGDDEICRSIRNLTANGTVWINSAGSGGSSHWKGKFIDSDGNGFNEFSKGDETIEMEAKAGDIIYASLSWNDPWDKTANDFDLYLIAPDGSSSVSSNKQCGIFGQKPVETTYMTAKMSGNYNIKIKKYNSSNPNLVFQLFSSHIFREHIVEESSLSVIASCPEVITVGAVDWSTLQIESFSPRGPTVDGRMKPDLVAPTNVTTMSYLPHMFNGTSSSAPYVAAMMALIIEKYGNSGMTNKEIKQLLFDNAIDLGPPGRDNTYGHGLANVKFLAGDWSENNDEIL